MRKRSGFLTTYTLLYPLEQILNAENSLELDFKHRYDAHSMKSGIYTLVLKVE